GATTTINATGHGLVNGDQIQFGNGSFPNGGSTTTDAGYQVAHGAPVFTVASAATNSFVLSGINSTTWTATSGGGTIFKVFKVAAGLLPAKTISGLDRISLFVIGNGNVIQGPNGGALPAQFVYDSDFDRLMYSAAPDSTGS